MTNAKSEKDPSLRKTQMNIALTPEDKKFLKVYAAERDIPVAEVIHQWIEEAKTKRDEKEE